MRSTTAPLMMVLLACSGCLAEPPDGDDVGRADFLVRTITEADRDLLPARAALVAGKYEKMAGSAQDYVRGSARVAYLDALDAIRAGTFRRGGGAEPAQLYGDIHMENIGAGFDDERPGAGMLVDCTDFDATARAPFDLEVRRAVTTLAVALDKGDQPADTLAAAGRALVAGYLAALQQSARDGVPPPLRPGPGPNPIGAILERTVAAALAERDMRGELARYTVDAHPRRFRTAIESDGDLDAVPEPFAAALPQMIRDYRRTRRGGPGDDARFAIKSAARKLGTGVSSFANLRFWVLVENGPGDADDVILELKEERDPPQPAALLARPPDAPPPPPNAVRVFTGESRLLSSERMDPDLGFVVWSGVSFIVRRETAGRRNFDVAAFAAQLKDGKWTGADIEDFSRTVGRLVGGGHARGGSAPAILRTIGDPAGDPAAWIEETVAAALADRERVMRDYKLFKRALADRGPLLGAAP